MIEQLNLSRTVNASTRVTKKENYIEVSVDGRIKAFTIFWPSGTDNLLGVSCGVNEIHLVPTTGEAMECEVGMRFPVDIKVDRGDHIFAQISNYSDSKNFHIGVYAEFEHS